MPKDVKDEWMAPALGGDPAAAGEVKSLNDISQDRQRASDIAAATPPPPPAPMPEPETPQASQPKPAPISDKDLAKLLEDSAKAMLDAAHSIDKGSTNLKKILAKLNFSGDKEIQGKVDAIAAGVDAMRDKVQTLSDAITKYRQSKIAEETAVL